MISLRAEDVRAALETTPSGLRLAVLPVEVEPLAFTRAGAGRFEGAFYFSSPDGSAVGGLGVAHKTSASGATRFTTLRGAIETLGLPSPYRIFTGFSFAPDGPQSDAWSSFGAADAVLPMATLLRRGDERHLLLAVPADVDEDDLIDRLLSLETPSDPPYPNLGGHSLESSPSVAEWTMAVGEAVEAIADDAIRKVVLARSVVIRSDEAPAGFDVVTHLERLYRQCFGFGWQANGATFVGASPELLVRFEDGHVTTNPLAGTTRRGEGDEEDRALAEALLRSDKDRIEHGFVVDDIVQRLRPLTEDLVVPKGPSLKRMATVQHLSTRIDGDARAGVHVLELVEALHPTPAVGGTPRAEAQAFIDKAESFDRGWYTGGIGWVDGGGAGEFAIGLRCGLLEGTRAHVFAGAGIVADSHPEAELVETRLKLRPLLELLAAT
ncbi:MAG: isochorismate synthase [Actinomycetota bacterium]